MKLKFYKKDSVDFSSLIYEVSANQNLAEVASQGNINSGPKQKISLHKPNKEQI